MKINKKLFMFIMPLILGIMLVSAGLIIHYHQSQVQINVEQPITVVGDNSYTIPNATAGGEDILGEIINVTNIAGFSVNVQITDDGGVSSNEGITVSYIGRLELTTKDVDFGNNNWTINGDKKAVVYYTIVGDSFDFKVENLTGFNLDDYTLIYYKDNSDRFNSPARAILADNITASLPYETDGNKDEYNYCGVEEDYQHCHGSKLWIVPTADINPVDNSLNWGDASNFLFETDLITYFKNSNGIVEVPQDNILDFYPLYTLASNLETGSYTITTSVDPITA